MRGMGTKDKRAKRIAKEEDVSYTAALQRVRDERIAKAWDEAEMTHKEFSEEQLFAAVMTKTGYTPGTISNWLTRKNAR